MTVQTPTNLWTPEALSQYRGAATTTQMFTLGTRPNDPGSRLARPFTGPELWGHSTISTTQKQGVMKRRVSDSKSNHQGHGDRDLGYK